MSANDTTTDLAPSLASEALAAPRPQYMTGFDGMATTPFPEEARKVLAEPPPAEAIEIKPDGIVYVPGVYYRRQLTRAFGAGGWAIVPRGPARVMGDLVVYPGALYCLGRFVAEAVGECTYRQNSNMSYASCVEGAKTDALSRCCKDLGMATELWDAGWRNQWKSDYAEQYDGEKWDKKKNVYVKVKLWRLRSGRPVQDINLMSGAGAPAAPASPPAGTTSAAPAAAQGERPKGETPQSAGAAKPSSEDGASGAGTSSPTIGAPASPDTGEAATAEQKEVLRSHVKRLGWKPHFAKMWLKGLFGFSSPDELTGEQAMNAIMLIENWGQGTYPAILGGMRRDGDVLPGEQESAA